MTALLPACTRLSTDAKNPAVQTAEYEMNVISVLCEDLVSKGYNLRQPEIDIHSFMRLAEGAGLVKDPAMIELLSESPWHTQYNLEFDSREDSIRVWISVPRRDKPEGTNLIERKVQLSKPLSE